MLGWLDYFFDADMFVPRAHCGQWDPVMIRVYQAASFLTFLAYLVLPIVLVSLSRSVVLLSHDSMFRLSFAGFILLCGLGHLEGVISFYWTQYHLFSVWHCMTAIISWFTLGRMIWLGLAGYIDSD